MFRRLLIANRGEIACRIMRTAARLGIHTIAVYSDADAGARHTRLADEAWYLGRSAPRESYLSIEKLVAVARAAGADAVHPGYGFLSERPEFGAALTAAGVAFVGPPPEVMAAIGSKRAAKEAMRRAGVPVLPGYHGEDQSLERLQAEALLLGFPLLVKPSAGGGGKGMQIVAEASALGAALESSRRLAHSAFGDDSLLLERYIAAPRHLEVQVLADAHDHVLHLHTRDCSVQRRHQKLIEEAPAPNLAAEIRERVHAAALVVAREVRYRNAGTVEFLYADGEFWFMEVNARLQVEHGVTEQILGIDLVEWQLRIAAGEPLSFDQASLTPRGHAIEVRVCAEDPAADFAPSAGRIDWMRWPRTDTRVRVDAGFETGDRVPSDYDSLLGKLIAEGTSLEEARSAMARALSTLRVSGVTTNAGWLAAALDTSAFRDAAISTAFAAAHAAELLETSVPRAEDLAIGALALIVLPPEPARDSPAAPHASPWDARDAFRVNLPALQTWWLRATHGDRRSYKVTVESVLADWRVAVDAFEGDEIYEVLPYPNGLEVRAGGRQFRREVRRDGSRVSLWREAQRIDFEIADPRVAASDSSADLGTLTARLPGTVVAVAVAPGAQVEKGATLIVLEAMKMEQVVRSPRAGTVSRVHFTAGDRVPEGALLLELEAEPAPARAAEPS
jgi:3-methylcrotonyl-CoA carboxylase alpha subunit